MKFRNIIKIKPKKNIHHFTCYLILTTCYLLFAPKIFAQQIGLSIFPPILEARVEPGKQITKAYEITNQSDKDIYLKAKIVPFSAKDNQGSLQLEPQRFLPDFFSLANSNLDLNQTFKLKKGQSQQLVLKINIPGQTASKDYYQVLLVEQTNQGNYLNQTGGQVQIKIASNILLSIGEIEKKQPLMEIKELAVQPKIADLFDQLNFKIIAFNPEKHFLKSSGNLVISHQLVDQQKTFQLLEENILSQTSRELKCKKTKTNQDQEEIIQPKACRFSSFIPGPYQAKIIANNKVLYQTNFWLLPIKASLAILIVLILIIQIIRRIKLDRNK